jgi:HK97 family phage prohead protease
MERKLYQVHSKSFDDCEAKTYKELWEKKQAEGFDGLKMNAVLELTKQEEKDNLFHAIFSTDKKDRHGEVVEQNFDLKSYKKNPVILDSHNYNTIEAIIGKAKRLKSEGKLEGDVEFALDNPRGFLAYKLASGGFLRASSIGFIPLNFSEDGMTIEKSELLEVSFVSVPANPEALIEKMQKSIEEAEPEEIIEASKEDAREADLGDEKTSEGDENKEEEVETKDDVKDSIPEKKTLEEIKRVETSKKEIRKNVYKSIARELDKMTRENQERRKGKIYKLLRNLIRE